jgi:hypothetical protein
MAVHLLATGYTKQKKHIRLMFGSDADFEEEELSD